MPQVKRWKYSVWIHSDKGDDVEHLIWVDSAHKEKAEHYVQEYARKQGSQVLNDFRLIA